MELTYDWRSFQSMFYPKRRSLVRQSAEPAGPVLVIREDDLIISAFAESEDLSDWIGARFEEMAAELSHRELVSFARADVDQWMLDMLALPHFQDQMEFLRSKAEQALASKSSPDALAGTVARMNDHAVKNGRDPLYRPHFLLSAIQGWWKKVLPSAYGIFIRLEGQPAEDLFILVRRGRLELFHKSDLSSMGAERCRQPEDVVKYLSEKHMVPVQGVFVAARDWLDWSDSPNPWGKIASGLQTDRVKLVPLRWDFLGLMTLRGVFGL
ncbi:MAG TPA: hypothetical protein VJB59_11520 [Bdellovibrionota bacterium]|nr:hypothetical protein [Bdellovibrionota bacterium]